MNDKSGTPTQLVAGFQDTTNYLDDTNCLGACVGRFAGRISGSFTLDGTSYPLHTVAPGVHLHGGQEGFFRKYWEMEEVGTGDCPYVRLSYESPHMEEGYPGNVRAEVTYTLEKQTLRISHRATTDRKTVVNLVNHSYFLLDASGSVGHYLLQLHSPQYLETRENLLPTGKIRPVKESPYDFTTARAVGGLHLDTPFVLDAGAEEAARLYSAKSGIRLRVKTNQPGVVVYTPREFAGICFETQNLPDAPNIPHFPSSILEPGAVYDNTSEFLFEIADGL